MDKTKKTLLVLPGYGGSGPKHWQSMWEASDAGFKRVRQKDWEHPVLSEWADVLGREIAAADKGVILVAHSLATLLVPHWAASAATVAPEALSKVKAAFLVAIPDPSLPIFPAAAIGFAPVPMAPLPFPSLVLASSNDSYGSGDFARRSAQSWGSRFVDVGPKGHINSDSGLGEWEEGRRLLESLF